MLDDLTHSSVKNDMAIHKLIAQKRAELGISQARLASRAGNGVKQQDVRRIEAGLTKTSKHIRPIIKALNISDDELGEFYDKIYAEDLAKTKPEPQFLGDRDLPVYAAAEGGPGSMVVSTDPIDLVPRPWFLQHVKDAYAVVVTGDSMDPVYEPGDMVLVNPRLPCIRGKDAIFVAGEEHGEFRASIKRYVGVTDLYWIAKQFNPPDGQKTELKLERKFWTRALRVVGKFTG